jgi:hypothetical protein
MRAQGIIVTLCVLSASPVFSASYICFMDKLCTDGQCLERHNTFFIDIEEDIAHFYTEDGTADQYLKRPTNSDYFLLRNFVSTTENGLSQQMLSLVENKHFLFTSHSWSAHSSTGSPTAFTTSGPCAVYAKDGD